MTGAITPRGRSIIESREVVRVTGWAKADSSIYCLAGGVRVRGRPRCQQVCDAVALQVDRAGRDSSSAAAAAPRRVAPAACPAPRSLCAAAANLARSPVREAASMFRSASISVSRNDQLHRSRGASTLALFEALALGWSSVLEESLQWRLLPRLPSNLLEL